MLSAVPHFSCSLLQLLPIPCDVRDPLSLRKFRLGREKLAVGSRCLWSNLFSANRSAFAGCSLLLLVMHKEVKGRAGAGAGAGRNHPLQMRSHPFLAPGDNSGALGTVCCHAGGEGVLDGPSLSQLCGAGANMPRRRQSWAGIAGVAVRQKSAEEHRNECRGKMREGKYQKW